MKPKRNLRVPPPSRWPKGDIVIADDPHEVTLEDFQGWECEVFTISQRPHEGLSIGFFDPDTKIPIAHVYADTRAEALRRGLYLRIAIEKDKLNERLGR